ncbi:MAG: hypothetical protein M3301_06310, partial [Chloroflexota bacterium]|nr:hypothetical protein [Chloroflexota bacterium]
TEPGLARAGQGDISVWRNLVFRSVDTAQTSPACATRARTAPASPTAPPGFEGIDIFDISTPSAPREVAHVATDCGSHTHTLVPDLGNNRLLLYVSSYPASYLSSTPTPWGNTCERLTGTGAQGHDKISIVEVPLNAPENARVIAEPHLNLAGPGFQGIPGFKGCHDISVLMPRKIAAGACLTEGIILDISNPAAPTVKQRLVNPAIDTCARAVPTPPANPLCLWHSATFTWDGKFVVFGDESGGGGSAECSSEDPATRGAFWLHRLSSPTTPIASFKIPRVQPAPAQICTAHIMNFVPINGRYVMPSSWYYGGTSVVNWTNLTAPTEMAFYEVEPSMAAGDAPYTETWTTYWYNDYIHANDINRGYDVFRLEVPWRSLAWNLRRLNPQTQEDLATCRVTATGPQLRARRARHVMITVRTRNGLALIGGQAVPRAHVRLRGAGISRMVMTDSAGMAHVRVRPTRRGTLRVIVQNDENLIGCRTQRVVRAAGVAGGGGRLTGSR